MCNASISDKKHTQHDNSQKRNYSYKCFMCMYMYGVSKMYDPLIKTIV